MFPDPHDQKARRPSADFHSWPGAIVRVDWTRNVLEDPSSGQRVSCHFVRSLESCSGPVRLFALLLHLHVRILCTSARGLRAFH